MNIPSILRHWFTLAATAATAWLIATVALAPEQQQELTKAIGDLVGPLVIIGTLIITALWRVALAWLTKVFRTGSGESGGGPGGLSLWMLISTAAVIGGSLPSCAIGEYPISGSITYRDDSTGAKAGLTFYPPARTVRGEK
jgi:hypothetical protein